MVPTLSTHLNSESDETRKQPSDAPSSPNFNGSKIIACSSTVTTAPGKTVITSALCGISKKMRGCSPLLFPGSQVKLEDVTNLQWGF